MKSIEERYPEPTDHKVTVIEGKNARVKIYTRLNHGRPLHQVDYVFQGAKYGPNRRDWGETLLLAQRAINEIEERAGECLTLTGIDLYNYRDAQQQAARVALKIVEVVKIGAEAIVKAAPQSPITLIEKYREENPVAYEAILIEDAREKWLTALDDSGNLIAGTFHGCRWQTNILLRKHPNQFLHDLDTKKVKALIESHTSTPDYRNTIRAKVLQFLRWCVTQKLMSKDQVKFDEIPKYKVRRGRVPFYSAQQLADIIGELPAHVGVMFILMAYGALRFAEIRRLQWEDVRWAMRQIWVSELVGKTGAREINCRDAVFRLIEPYRHCKGAVSLLSRDAIENEVHATLKRLRIKPIRNGPRHSYGTFECALTDNNIGVVSEKMGNSPKMVKTHYRGRIEDPTEVQKYQAITPTIRSLSLSKDLLTEEKYREMLQRRTAWVRVELAKRAKELPDPKRQPAKYAEAIARIKETAYDDMADAPLPDFQGTIEKIGRNDQARPEGAQSPTEGEAVKVD